MSAELKAQEILNASKLYTVCVSFTILFAGVFGHVIDILVFTSSKSFRNKQSAFYLTAESIVNCVHLLVSFTSRIAINGFDNDLTKTSIVWCKLRQLFATSCTLLSLTIVCFAAIDQYLSTSYNPYLKQLSTLKLAHCLTYSATIVWILHSIPFMMLTEIRPTYGCSSSNKGLDRYITYVYYLIFTGFLPIVITSIFATLAYINVRRIVRSQIPIIRRRLDRQLTAMILVRVAFLVATTLLYVINRIYTMQVQVNQDDYIQKAIIQLVGAIAYSLFYLNYSGSFYLFLISSERFRRQVKYLLVKKFWRTYCTARVRNNRIVPISHISSVECD
ncbi:unnamed protein product [Rotaria sordida]|uniref:G-protein coupled receptors family 1 profile domain-containing protein n=1 Tax=Rotaria sordida TaxID=392033 RepID=A0A818RI55_9BILA|nr:unnamed protein product [Rotaria sordida]CAF1416360.1 unnamed protein product [Rotaria sordida]CAF1422888.1 unnamed protein product [Rotaria sordida]CAF3657952.1 unnamed protein product [Rotaria sordida]CAF3667597.1 unnamed protein product [Rotaria sordida]